MKNGLLVLERIVIESLIKKEMNIEELVVQTGLSHGLLLNILPNLIMNFLVKYERGQYSLNREMIGQWSKEINKIENLKEEAREIFNSLVNSYFKQEVERSVELKIQKLWLTADEEKLLNGHLKNLESFFKNIKEQRLRKPVVERTKQQKVIVWGHLEYSNIIQEVLEAV